MRMAMMTDLPRDYPGPKPDDFVYVSQVPGEPRRAWIENPAGTFEATDLLTDIDPIPDGYRVTGRRRTNGTIQTADPWSVEVDVLEGGGDGWQGRVRP